MLFGPPHHRNRLRDLHRQGGQRPRRTGHDRGRPDLLHLPGRRRHDADLPDRGDRRPAAGRPSAGCPEPQSRRTDRLQPDRAPRELPGAQLHADVGAARSDLLSHLAADRPGHAGPHAGRRQLPVVRKQRRPNLCRVGREDHVRRCGRAGRGEGDLDRDRRFPARSLPLCRDRGLAAEGRPACRPSRNRQDAHRAGRSRRGEGAVLRHLGIGVRADVRRHGGRQGPRPLQAGEREGSLHHLHRRDRRRRQAARRRLRRQRRTRADAQPAPDRDGRLRRPPRASTRRCCVPGASTAGFRWSCPTSRGARRFSACIFGG